VDIKSDKRVESPVYEELIFDANDFQENLRHDTAVLYAAFAAEAMLWRICTNLLERQQNHASRQNEENLDDLSMGQLITRVEQLFQGPKPHNFDGQGLRKLSKLRNAIAHGKNQTVTAQQADEAIRVTLKLKTLLSR
jgi:hypothetical protein